jgi:hypothetical protein
MKITQEKTVIGLGVWLFVLPFTGFPSGWKTMLTVATALVLMYLGALLLKGRKEREYSIGTETKTGTFTESREPSL